MRKGGTFSLRVRQELRVKESWRKMRMTKKPKSVFFKIVFSRTMITILLILFQFLMLFGIFLKLGSYSTLAMVVLNLLGTLCLLYLINKDDIAEFIKCPGAIKTRICGIGFAAKSYYQINLDCGIREVDVGDVIIRNSFDEIAIMDSDTYSMIFKTND